MSHSNYTVVDILKNTYPEILFDLFSKFLQSLQEKTCNSAVFSINEGIQEFQKSDKIKVIEEMQQNALRESMHQ